MACAMILQHHGLAGARRRHDQGALALAERRDQVDDAGGDVLDGAALAFELETLVRVERRQVVEIDAVAHLVGRREIDVVDLEQREIALAVLGRADLALDGIAGAQAEAAHLGRADVDVVGAGQIVGLGRAQEAEAVLQDLEHAVAEDGGVVFRQLLEDGEHHVLPPQARGVFDFQFFGVSEKLGRGFLLEFLEIHRSIGG